MECRVAQVNFSFGPPLCGPTTALGASLLLEHSAASVDLGRFWFTVSPSRHRHARQVRPGTDVAIPGPSYTNGDLASVVCVVAERGVENGT